MKNKKSETLKPPGLDIWDYLYKANKAALSTIPPLGAFYELVIAPPFQKRTLEFMKSIAEKCMELENKLDDFRPVNLVKNELFQSTFNYAARIAAQTHQNEKLDALQNAILNSVIIKNIDEAYKLIFFSYIETMTSLHITVIKFMDDWEKKNYESVEGTVGQADPFFSKYSKEFPINYDLFEQVCNDLEIKNLLKSITTPPNEGNKTWPRNVLDSFDIKIWNLTPEGKNFLYFITDPIRIINSE
jgi:hypothetical protein